MVAEWGQGGVGAWRCVVFRMRKWPLCARREVLAKVVRTQASAA